MKRTFRKYPKNINAGKQIPYDRGSMDYAGETPKEIITTLNSIISENNLKWFYGLKNITVHWAYPFPSVICKDDQGSTILIGKPKPFSGPMTWYYTEPRDMDAKLMREIADMLDVLNNSSELNDLITNFEEYYGEES